MKKPIASVLAALVINLVCVTAAPAAPKPTKEEQFAAKVKAGILKLGTGPAARVQVKLRNGTKLKGYVAEAGEEHFVVPVLDDRQEPVVRVGRRRQQ